MPRQQVHGPRPPPGPPPAAPRAVPVAASCHRPSARRMRTLRAELARRREQLGHRHELQPSRLQPLDDGRGPPCAVSEFVSCRRTMSPAPADSAVAHDLLAPSRRALRVAAVDAPVHDDESQPLGHRDRAGVDVPVHGAQKLRPEAGVALDRVLGVDDLASNSSWVIPMSRSWSHVCEPISEPAASTWLLLLPVALARDSPRRRTWPGRPPHAGPVRSPPCSRDGPSSNVMATIRVRGSPLRTTTPQEARQVRGRSGGRRSPARRRSTGRGRVLGRRALGGGDELALDARSGRSTANSGTSCAGSVARASARRWSTTSTIEGTTPTRMRTSPTSSTPTMRDDGTAFASGERTCGAGARPRGAGASRGRP